MKCWATRLAAAIRYTVLALSMAVPVQAQITLIPKPQHQVAQSPEYLAVADFDGDGFQDVVVSNDIEDKVTVLIGSGQSTFRRDFEISVGQSLGRVAAGDVNGDGKPDIVTIDSNRRRYYAFFNRGSALFHSPVSLDIRQADRAAGVRPVDVAIGRFDADAVGDPSWPLYDLAFAGRDFVGQRLRIDKVACLVPEASLLV